MSNTMPGGEDMSMTPDERKAWAYGRLDAWLRDYEHGAFFDAIDQLALGLEELGECPDAKRDCCKPYHKGDAFQAALPVLAEVIERTALAFTRQAS